MAQRAKLGNRWAKIARMLPGRSDNDVKNRWYASLRKRVDEGEYMRRDSWPCGLCGFTHRYFRTVALRLCARVLVSPRETYCIDLRLPSPLSCTVYELLAYIIFVGRGDQLQN